jgi:hypothetical protein
MRDLMTSIREYTVWLHQTLFEYGLFYIDLWSLVHFWSGMIIFVSLTALGWRNRWRWLLYFLAGFEVVEATIFISVLKMFMPEKLPDSFTDIFIGFAGAYFVYFLFERLKINGNYSRLFLIWLSACTVSFLWAGNHAYTFNNPALNKPGINWWVFLFWMVVGMAILYVFNQMKSGLGHAKSVVLACFAWFIPLIILIRMTTPLFVPGKNASVIQSNMSGLNSGETMNFFYLAAPLIFIYIYDLLAKLFERYQLKSGGNEIR